MSAEFEKILPVLVKGGVDFILIGGGAGIVHGAARATYDVDVVYCRTKENIARLPRPSPGTLRIGAVPPPDLPFAWNSKTISSGLNFTLTTALGDLDLFGEVSGNANYSDLLPHSFEVEAFGVRFRCVDLPALIRIKEAAGRPKDFEAIAELRVLLEERSQAP